ncbi:GreA/GreB family elongation factor [Psychrosphaera sp. B3R10]|uniref:GreA/GreB family elongation factor n=1 Tax=unclassified Psychrosphaera TaxID=2641570 RepID=UPI001C097252|nr:MULTISPECIES: GreA/GreB family elongation factor [unclassified Psychrosphaera]MBU2883417.1 GreA/GreB family elongation factor [Psychrosphaera sp. I2R16]MBU2990489.1 GreA/GreB family elongation factor [Psychrosphaera sp. B3R10]
MENQPDIIISEADLAKIEDQLERSKLPKEFVLALEDELARANILKSEAMPGDVVMLASQVTFKVVATERTFTKTLCLPVDMERYQDAISLFAPLGSAILGLSTGQKITWNIQDRPQVVEIVNVRKSTPLNLSM